MMTAPAPFAHIGLVLQPAWAVPGARPDATFARVLISDLRTCSAGTLPVGVSSLSRGVLKGPFLLQVEEATNVAVCAEERAEAARGGKRVRKFLLTDGMQQVFALELRELDASLTVGTKLVVRDVPVRRGLLLLTPAIAAFLGGSMKRRQQVLPIVATAVPFPAAVAAATAPLLSSSAANNSASPDRFDNRTGAAAATAAADSAASVVALDDDEDDSEFGACACGVQLRRSLPLLAMFAWVCINSMMASMIPCFNYCQYFPLQSALLSWPPRLLWRLHPVLLLQQQALLHSVGRHPPWLHHQQRRRLKEPRLDTNNYRSCWRCRARSSCAHGVQPCRCGAWMASLRKPHSNAYPLMLQHPLPPPHSLLY